MTFKAREVLNDCRLALSMLEQEEDYDRWRVHWAAAVALVRAVGHVLDKVDGRDTALRQVAAARFKQWKGTSSEHEIFREFIERERNNLLKEYHSDVHPLEDVPVAVQMVLRPPNGGPEPSLGHAMNMDKNTYRPMLEGPWEGDDARDVLQNAIEWWDVQLDELERAAQALRRKQGKQPRKR